MLVEFTGVPIKGVYSKDYILALIAVIRRCLRRYVVEYRDKLDALKDGRAE